MVTVASPSCSASQGPHAAPFWRELSFFAESRLAPTYYDAHVRYRRPAGTAAAGGVDSATPGHAGCPGSRDAAAVRSVRREDHRGSRDGLRRAGEEDSATGEWPGGRSRRRRRRSRSRSSSSSDRQRGQGMLIVARDGRRGGAGDSSAEGPRAAGRGRWALFGSGGQFLEAAEPIPYTAAAAAAAADGGAAENPAQTRAAAAAHDDDEELGGGPFAADAADDFASSHDQQKRARRRGAGQRSRGRGRRE